MLMGDLIFPPWEPVNASNPPSERETLDALYERIDDYTDRIGSVTRSPFIRFNVGLLWDAVEDMYHVAADALKAAER